MLFGILKAHFRCLGGLRPQSRLAVAECAVLHIMASSRKERAPPVSQPPPNVVDPIIVDHTTGRALREAIMQQYFA